MLFEVLLRQRYNSKNVLNRWHYSGTGTPAAVQMSFALASALGGIPDPTTHEFPTGSLMAHLAALMTGALFFVELVVENLYEVSDFYTIPYSPDQHGLASGVPMSEFNAYAVQSNRVRTDIRRGNKRFCGVNEEAVGNFGIVSGSYATELTAVASVMSNTLTYDDEGNTLSFQPAVLSFEKHAPDADHDEPWYAKYPTLVEQLEHAALGVSWSAKPNVTTQNSRKK